jgi:hypothetical protein
VAPKVVVTIAYSDIEKWVCSRCSLVLAEVENISGRYCEDCALCVGMKYKHIGVPAHMRKAWKALTDDHPSEERASVVRLVDLDKVV